MRYYFIIDPIEDLQTGFLGLSIESRTITQDEIMQIINRQTTIKLFTNYDQAKELAHGMRENAYDYTHWPKTSVSRSKVRPLITIDVEGELHLSSPQHEKFAYQKHYLDSDHFSQTRSKEIDLTYYVVNRDQIRDEWIKRAEFYNSRLKPLEFDFSQADACVIS